MGSLVVRVMAAGGAAALSFAMFGSGVAAADALTGQTYADAVAKVSDWNAEAKIVTVNGDQLATDDCIVVSWQRSSFIDALGENRGSEILLNLNCNAPLAAPGKPGNSAATPEARELKQRQQKDEVAAGNINQNPALCEKSDEKMEWCQKICARSGLCEV
jgi:hypothetical protein